MRQAFKGHRGRGGGGGGGGGVPLFGTSVTFLIGLFRSVGSRLGWTNLPSCFTEGSLRLAGGGGSGAGGAVDVG